MLQAGVNIYALQDLHSKLYTFDEESVITGSANFTFNGFYKNHEFGIFMEKEPAFAKECSDYFYGLLKRIQESGNWLVTQQKIDIEKEKIDKSLPGRKGKRKDPTLVEYNDFKWGAQIEEVSLSGMKVVKDPQSDFIETALQVELVNRERRDTGIWIKFEGNSEDRVPNDEIYLVRKKKHYDDQSRTFFRRRPSGIKNGHLVFMAVVSYDRHGNGTPMIVGYAETNGFLPGNEIGPNDRFYKETSGRYPYYVRLHNGRYLYAPIKYGVSLIDLCRDLGVNLYPSKKQHPSEILTTHHQKSHIQITEVARDYLIKKLEEQIKKHGDIITGTFAE